MIISRKQALFFCVIGAVMLLFNNENPIFMVVGMNSVFLGLYPLNKMAKAQEETPPSSASEEE
jgi:hypothetical protein